jgi:hypothetical protein
MSAKQAINNNQGFVMKKVILPIVAILFLIQSSSYSQNNALYEESFVNLGIVSTVHYYNPNRLGQNGPFPLIICLPDVGQSPSNMRDIIYNAVMSRQINAIVACPNVNNIQNISQLTNVFQFILHDAITFENADSNKIIVSGLSHGGRFAFFYGMLNLDIYAGIIGISPIITKEDLTPDIWSDINKQKIAVIMGELDDAYDNTCIFMDEVENYGGDHLFLRKPGVGNNDANYLFSSDFYDDFKQCVDFIFGVSSVEDNLKIEDNSLITITPNPVFDDISIDLTDIANQINSIKIININGEEVHETYDIFRASGNTIKLNVTDLPAGVYLILVNTNEKIYSNRFVKF